MHHVITHLEYKLVGCILKWIFRRIAHKCKRNKARRLLWDFGSDPFRSLESPVTLGVNLDRHPEIGTEPCQRNLLYSIICPEVFTVGSIFEFPICHDRRVHIHLTARRHCHIQFLQYFTTCLENDFSGCIFQRNTGENKLDHS